MKLKQFLLKKFPTHEYMDCPIPKHHWETIQEFADEQAIGFAYWTNQFYNYLGDGKWFSKKDSHPDYKFLKIEELLTIYKNTL